MSSGLNPDTITTAAINWKGDGAFQALYSNVGSLWSLVISGMILGLIYAIKKPKWKLGTFGILLFVTYYILNGWVIPFVTSLNGTSPNVTGNGMFKGILALTNAGAVLVSLLVAMLLSKRMGWGIPVGLIMTVVMSIAYIHWWLPLWHSTGINLGGMSIPGFG